MTVTLVVPCYNPPPGWEQTVYAGYLSFCSSIQNTATLILVMDGGGEDISDSAISFLQENIPLLSLVKYPENRGKGYAIRQGVAQASSALIIYTDVDFPYTPESMLAVYKSLQRDECDVAMGVKDIGYYAHVPFLRRIISRCLRLFIRLLLSMPVTDTQCGLKGFKNRVAPVFLATTIDRYLFDLEFIRNCYRSKAYRVKAIPVALNERVHFRSMNYRILLPEMVNFIKLVLRG